jgi:protease PrsW
MASLSIWKFTAPDGAEQALGTLARLQAQRLIVVQDASVVSWPQGRRKPRTWQARDVAGAAALSGAFCGLLFGILFLLPLVGLAAGAAAGLAAGAFAHIGLSDDFLRRIRDEITPGTSALFISGRRLPYSVGGAAIGAAAFFGGVIGLIMAGTLEYDAARDLGSLPMIGVGLIEETSKLVIPLVILLFAKRYRTPANGLLLGVAAGAGFAALETMGYAFTTLLTSRGSITATVDELLLRGFLSPAGHMAWTGIAATALYTAAAAGWQRRRVVEFVVAFAVAVGLHALWDSQSSLIGTAVVAVVSLAALGWTVHRVHTQSRTAAFADAPRPGVR